MELWIRSQDKKRLFKARSLYVVGADEEYYVGDKEVGHIGKYKTEKKALEVLDEIQNLLIPTYFVYNMSENYINKKLQHEIPFKTKLIRMDGLFPTQQINNLVVYEMPQK